MYAPLGPLGVAAWTEEDEGENAITTNATKSRKGDIRPRQTRTRGGHLGGEARALRWMSVANILFLEKKSRFRERAIKDKEKKRQSDWRKG
jgi:hypothetical protein